MNRSGINVNSKSNKNKKSSEDYLNARSINQKADSIQILAKKHKTNISIAEHCIHEDASNINYFDGWVTTSTYCRRERRGGGVMLINVIELDSISLDSFNKLFKEGILECCATKYEQNGMTLVVLTLYRPLSAPVMDFLIHFERIALELIELYLPVLICGDFNIDISVNDSRKCMLIDLITSVGLHVVGCGVSTREMSNAASEIDFFVTNLPENVYRVEVINCDLSNHYPIVFK